MSPISLVDHHQVTLEIAISKITGRILIRVCAKREEHSTEQEFFWAEGMTELQVDLGRERLLVMRADGTNEWRERE